MTSTWLPFLPRFNAWPVCPSQHPQLSPSASPLTSHFVSNIEFLVQSKPETIMAQSLIIQNDLHSSVCIVLYRRSHSIFMDDQCWHTPLSPNPSQDAMTMSLGQTPMLLAILPNVHSGTFLAASAIDLIQCFSLGCTRPKVGCWDDVIAGTLCPKCQNGRA